MITKTCNKREIKVTLGRVMHGHWCFGSGSLRSSRSDAWAVQLPINLGSLMGQRVSLPRKDRRSSPAPQALRASCLHQQPVLTSLVQRHEHVRPAVLFHSTSLTDQTLSPNRLLLDGLVKTEINLDHMITSALLSAGSTKLNLPRV